MINKKHKLYRLLSRISFRHINEYQEKIFLRKYFHAFLKRLKTYENTR